MKSIAGTNRPEARCRTDPDTFRFFLLLARLFSPLFLTLLTGQTDRNEQIEHDPGATALPSGSDCRAEDVAIDGRSAAVRNLPQNFSPAILYSSGLVFRVNGNVER